MVMVIDLMETKDGKRAVDTWSTVSDVLSECPGFQDRQLVETFSTIFPRADYTFGSFCRWESEDKWQQARSFAKDSPEVVDVLSGGGVTFTSITADLKDGRDFQFSSCAKHMVLIDVIYLAPSQINGYADMWGEANTHMADLPGYVNASLYKNVRADDPIKFVNIAEWETPELFNDAAHGERFLEIVDPYKNNFSLFLTKRIPIKDKADMSSQKSGEA